MTDPLLVAPDDGEPKASAKGPFPFRRAVALVRQATRPAAVGLYVVLALVSGLLEAGVIVIVVATAASLTEGASALEIDAGPLSTTLSTGEGVLIGLGLTVALLACGFPSAWLAARIASRLLAWIRSRLLRSLVGASWEQQSMVLPARVQDLAAVHAFQTANLFLVLAGLLTSVLGLLALIAAAFLVDPLTATALVVVVVVLAICFRPLIRTVRRRSANHVAAHHQYVESLSNALGVLREIRIYGVRAPVAAEVDGVNATAVHEYRQMMFRGLLVPVLYLGATFGLLLLGLAVASTQDDLDFTQIGAITLFLLRGLRYSRSAQSAWQAAMEHVPYLEAVDDALRAWGPTSGDFGSRRLERVGRLDLQDVSYAYPTGEVGIADLTLTLEPGQIVGLEGPSGAGKSTIGQIVLGLRRPRTGRYLVDGTPVEEFDELDWHSRFAYVAQDATLVRGTIRENVRFFRPEITAEAIVRAVQEAGLGPDLARWEDGLEREVGAGGGDLSGGQRQRITIARALAGDPDVIVMDEPTSSLDPASEEIVRSALDALRGRITVLLIAHRASTLSVCDRVLHVERNRARERPMEAT